MTTSATLHELESPSAVSAFLTSHAYSILCFSATWCGPCTASKPQYTALAETYHNDVSLDVTCGIVYEHNIKEAIQNYGIRAFPTYVLFEGNKELERIQGVNFEGVKAMVNKYGCQKVFAEGSGNTLGSNSSSGDVSMEEARKLRLKKLEALIEKSAKKNDEPMKTDDDENEPMKTDENDNEENVNKDTDAEMQDSSATAAETTACTPCPEQIEDPRIAKLSAEDIQTLTESMGFTLLRAQKAMLQSQSGVEGAIEWLMAHQDDDDIDAPIPMVNKDGSASAIAQSYKCNECGKILSNMANLELHANKTGHSDFEESTDQVKPLSAEQKAAKIEEIKTLLKLKREERQEAEKVANVDREKRRREDGKKTKKTKAEMESLARKRETALRKKEKDNFRKERMRIKMEIEKDKLERRANKGKMGSRIGVDGYNPDGIQYDVDNSVPNAAATAPSRTGQPAPKKSKGNVAKIDEYISKISSYQAGGDGGKCLKILLAYIKNVVANPTEDKFKKINMDNKTYKTKVKPFVGAKILLMAVGFAPNDGNTALVLGDDSDMEVLAQTKEKLEKAFAAY